MSLAIMSFTITDADGDTSTCVVHVPQGTLTLADLTGAMDDYAALIDGLIDGFISNMHLTLSVSVPAGLATSAVANSEVQKGALFQFSAANTPYKYSVRVPSFTPGKFSGNAVNESDQDVIDFLSAMVTGITPVATLVSPSDKYENDITAHVAARKSFRK